MSVDPVETLGLGRTYGRTRALRDVDARFEGGRACALLGPNGAGKSTLLAILARLARPTAGEVRWGGRRDVERAHVGFLGHGSLVYGDLTARENLEWFARLYAVRAWRERAAELVARLGLGEAADRAARTLSRGQLQRLSLGRAVVHRPRLVLLDEPFTGLDADATAVARALIREEAEAGAVVVVATHDLAAVAGVVSRALALRDGRVAALRGQDGPLGEADLRDLVGAAG